MSDLTVRTGPTWGVGIVTWHTLGATLQNLDVRGGYYAVGDLFLGAQYPLDVRDCVLSGSEAGFCGMSNIVYLRNVTFEPVGRYGILLAGSNCMLDDVRFVEPEHFHSEYYFRHLGTVQYGGMNLLTGVRAEAPKGSSHPSRAAFSQDSIAGTRTSLNLRDCRVANMGPESALIELQSFPRPAPCLLVVEEVAYEGNSITALVRTEAPWWSGEVTRFRAEACKRLLDYQPRDVPAWLVKRKYAKGAAVMGDRQVYECVQEHESAETNRPGIADSRGSWQLRVPRIFFDRKNQGDK